jgi:hypothetical protein
MVPSSQPIGHPTSQPSTQPSFHPSTQPSSQPSCQPSSAPSLGLSYDYVNISSIELVTTGATVAVIKVHLSEKAAANVYCAAFQYYVNPNTVSDVVEKGAYVSATLQSFSVSLSNLVPTTQYRIYCVTSSLAGNFMPLQILRSKYVDTVTLCCKTIKATVLQSAGISGQETKRALQVYLDFEPKSTLRLTWSLLNVSSTPVVSAVHSALVLPIVVPSTIVFNSTTQPLTSKEFSVFSGLAIGAFAIQLQCTGASCADYSIVYSSLRSFDVLESNNASNYPPPKVLFARFSDDGGKVRVTFDKQTNRANVINYFSCSSLFAFSAVVNSVCRWEDDASILIEAPYSASTSFDVLTIGSNISIVEQNSLRAACPNSVSAADCTTFRIATVEVFMIQAAEAPVIPVPVISIPNAQVQCKHLVVDVSSSTGFAGRSWTTYQFIVKNSRTFHVAEIEEFLNGETYSLIPATPVPPSLLFVDSTYTIEVVLCNFLGKCGRSSSNVYISPEESPVIAAKLLGSTSQIITSKDVVYSQATAEVSECIKRSYQIVYEWEVLFSNRSSISAIKSKSSNPAVFLLAPYTLRPSNNYIVNLYVSSPSVGNYRASSTLLISVKIDTVEAILSAPSTFVSPGRYIILNGSLSRDLDIPNRLGLSAGLEYQWSCIQTAPSYSENCPLRFVSFPYQRMQESELVNVTAHSNAVNSTARVTLTVSSKSRYHSASVDIAILAAIVPSNSIVVSLQGMDASNVFTNRRISFEGIVTTVASGCVAYWSVNDPSIWLQNISSTPLQEFIPFRSSGFVSKLYLTILPNTIPMGAHLTFSLTCGNSKHSIVIFTNRPPQPGSFEITPVQGFALETQFVFGAIQWSDDELPLLYSFAYYFHPSSSYVTFRGSSLLSLASTLLPSGNSPFVSCLLLVYDRMNASGNTTRLVHVEDANSSTTSSYLQSVTFNLGNPEETRATLAVVGSVLNSVNCTNVGHVCAKLNRHPCLTVSQTCGECLQNYLGELGASNTICLPEEAFAIQNLFSEFSFGTASEFAKRQLTLLEKDEELDDSISKMVSSRGLMGTMPLSNISLPITCRLTSECQAISPWLFCQRPLRTCGLLPKTCPADCSGRGSCLFYQTNSGASRTLCFLNDATCASQCECDTGYFGAGCEYTAVQWAALQSITSRSLQTLRNLTEIDDLSSANVRTWIDLFFVLSAKTNQFSGDVLGDAFYIASKSISFYESLVDASQDVDDSVLNQLATAVDRVASVASFLSAVNGANSSLLEANNSYFWSRGLTDFGSRYCALQKFDQYAGAVDKSIVYDTFRCKVSVVMVNSLQPANYNWSSVKTTVEKLYGIESTTLTLATKNNSLKTTQPIVVSIVEFIGRVYRNERSLNSNPMIVSIDIRGSTFVPSATISTGFLTDSDRRRYLSQFVDSVEWDIQHFQPLRKFAYDFVVKNFTSFCFGTKDFSHYKYLCEDSGITLDHYCQGRRGLLLSYCPKPVPACAQIDGILNSTVDELELIKLAPLCEVSMFNTTHTTCACKFAASADKNYTARLSEDPSDDNYYYYADEAPKANATVASYLINRDYDVEFGIGNAYIPYRFADTFTEMFPPGLSPSPWVLISMFSSLYLLLVLFALSRGKYLHLSSKQKKIVVQDQLPPVITADLGDKVMTPESFFVKYLQFTSSILPGVYSNMSPWQRLSQELQLHHRYVQVLRREEDPAWMSKIVRVVVRIILTHLCIIFILAFLLDYHIRTGETLCGESLDEESCLDLTMHLDYTRRACEWKKDPPPVTIIRPTDLQPVVIPYHCVFIQDQFTAIGLAFVCAAAMVGASVFGQVMSMVLDKFDAQLIPLKLKQEANEATNSRKHKSEGGRHPNVKSDGDQGSRSKKIDSSIVAAEPLPSNVRTAEMHWISKIIKRFADATRRYNSVAVEHVTLVKQVERKDVVAEEYRLLSPAIKHSFDEVRHFQDVYFATSNVFRYSTALGDFLPENRLYLDKKQVLTPHNNSFVSKAVIQRREYLRRSSLGPNVGDPSGNVDSVLQDIRSNQAMLDWIQVEINQRNSISIDGMRDVRFLAYDHRQAWQLMTTDASSSSQPQLHSVPLRPMKHRIAEVIREGERFLLNLRAVPSRQMHAAVEMQHLFLVDLLGTDKPEAVIYHRKFHEDQRIAKPVPESMLHLIMVIGGCILLFLAVYPVTIITKHTFIWQWYLLVSIAGCVTMEVFVLATLDCLLFQVWIPGLVWHTVRHAHREAMLHTSFALQELLSARLGDVSVSGGNAYPLSSRSVMSYNALRGFHVSNYVAQSLPGSFEAVLLLFYRDLLPPVRDERKWCEMRHNAANPPFWRRLLRQVQRWAKSADVVAPHPASLQPVAESSEIDAAAEEARSSSLVEREDALLRPWSRAESVMPVQAGFEHGRQRGVSQEVASRQRLRSRIDSRMNRRNTSSVHRDPVSSLLDASGDVNHQHHHHHHNQQQFDVFVNQGDEMGLFGREVRAVARVISFIARVIVGILMFFYNIIYFALGLTTVALHYRLVALFGNRHVSYDAWKILFSALTPLYASGVTVLSCLFVAMDGSLVALDEFNYVLIALVGFLVLVLIFAALYQHFITADVLDFPVLVHSDSNTWQKATKGRFGHLIPEELLNDRIGLQVEEIQKMELKLPPVLSPEHSSDTAALEKLCEDYMSWRRTQQEMEQLRLQKDQEGQRQQQQQQRLEAFAERDEDSEEEGSVDSSSDDGEDGDGAEESESESEGSYSDSENESEDIDPNDTNNNTNNDAEVEEIDEEDDEKEDEIDSCDEPDWSALHQPRAAPILNNSSVSGRSSRQRLMTEEQTTAQLTDSDVDSAVSTLVGAMSTIYIPNTTTTSPVLRGPMHASRFASLQFQRANSQQHEGASNANLQRNVGSRQQSMNSGRAASLFASTNNIPPVMNATPFDASPVPTKTRPIGAMSAGPASPSNAAAPRVLQRQVWAADSSPPKNSLLGKQEIRDNEDPEMQQLPGTKKKKKKKSKRRQKEEEEDAEAIQIVIQTHFSPSAQLNEAADAGFENSVSRDQQDDTSILASSADDVDEEQGQSSRMLGRRLSTASFSTASFATVPGDAVAAATAATATATGSSPVLQRHGMVYNATGMRIPEHSPRPQPQAKRVIKVSRASIESMFSVDSYDDADAETPVTANHSNVLLRQHPTPQSPVSFHAKKPTATAAVHSTPATVAAAVTDVGTELVTRANHDGELEEDNEGVKKGEKDNSTIISNSSVSSERSYSSSDDDDCDDDDESSLIIAQPYQHVATPVRVQQPQYNRQQSQQMQELPRRSSSALTSMQRRQQLRPASINNNNNTDILTNINNKPHK